jgi:CBS domain-containing protein
VSISRTHPGGRSTEHGGQVEAEAVHTHLPGPVQRPPDVVVAPRHPVVEAAGLAERTGVDLEQDPRRMPGVDGKGRHRSPDVCAQRIARGGPLVSGNGSERTVGRLDGMHSRVSDHDTV